MNSPLNPIPISTLPYFPQMEPRDFIPRPQRLLRTHPAHSQVFRTNENRPVGFSAAGKIFAARDFFDGLPVGSECFQLVLAIPAEMIVQGLFADFTTYAAFSVLAPKGDDFAIKDTSLLRRRKFQMLWPCACLCSFTWLRADDGSILCADDEDSRLGSIADRCDTSRDSCSVRWLLSFV